MPLIVTGMLISVAVFLVNDRVVPKTTMKANEIKEEYIDSAKRRKKGKKGKKILENLALYGKGHKIIYVRKYSSYDNKIEDIIIHDQDKSQNIISKTTARYAEWIEGKWYGKDIVFFPLDSDGRIIGDPEFYDEGLLNIKETPADFRKRSHQSRFMSFELMSYGELEEYIERLSFESGPTVRNMKVALNQKVAFPFVNVIVVLIASPFALIHTRKGGVMLGIAISMVLVFGYYAFMTISLALGRSGFVEPALSAWMSNIVFAFAGLMLIVRHK